MALNLPRFCAFKQLSLAAAFTFSLLSPPATATDVDELLHTPGQQAAYSLFLAMQSIDTPPAKESGDILLMAGVPFGLGDITYLVKLKQIFKNQLGQDAVKVVFFSDQAAKDKAVQVFADQLGDDYIWIDTSPVSTF